MRILVTGGAGFVGSHIADLALEQGHRVAVLDDLSSGREDQVPRGAEFHRVDIRDPEGVRRVFSVFRPEVVSHQAALASVSASVRLPVLDADVNVAGSINVLETARQSGTRLFIFASTGGAIYGDIPEG